MAAVQSGQTTSGRKGNLVYAVAPVTLSAKARAQIDRRARVPFEGTFAVLLTRDVGGPRPELGLLHHRRRRRAAGRRARGLADVTPYGAAAGRGHEGDGPHRVRRAGEPRAGRPPRLSRVRLARRLHQRHGPEPRGRPRPRAPSAAGGLPRPAHAAHLHPRVRRGHRRRCDRGQPAGGRRHHRGIAPPRAPRRATCST